MTIRKKVAPKELEIKRPTYFFRPFYNRYMEDDQTKFEISLPAKIVVVGCGGNGGYLVPLIARFLSTSPSNLFRAIQIVLIDGDTVSEKNILRQNFVQCEIGMNKAQAIADRCNANFGTNIDVIPDFMNKSILENVLTQQVRHDIPPELCRGQVLLVGCVDRDEARKAMCDSLSWSSRVCYVDVGNELKAGQVFISGIIKMNHGDEEMAVAKLLMSDIYPKIQKAEAGKAEPSCAEQTSGGLQKMDVNVKAATLTFEVICSMLSPVEIPYYEMTFGPGVVRTEKIDSLKSVTDDNGILTFGRP